MTAIQRYQPPALEEWQQYQAMAADIAKAKGFVPAAYRDQPHAILAAVLTGRELGIGPMQALRDIYMVDGKPTMSAQLMLGLVLRAGHHIRVVDASASSVTVEGCRKGSGDMEKVTWTIEEAKAAGLAGKDNWKKYPRAMLRSRAVTELCRSLFADVLAGVAYTAEELDDDLDVADDVAERTWVQVGSPEFGSPELDREVTEMSGRVSGDATGKGVNGTLPDRIPAPAGAAGEDRPLPAPAGPVTTIPQLIDALDTSPGKLLLRIRDQAKIGRLPEHLATLKNVHDLDASEVDAVIVHFGFGPPGSAIRAALAADKPDGEAP